MNIVPVTWSNNQTHYNATRQDVAHAGAVQRPPLRVLQEQRANDAAQAVSEYEASQLAVEEKKQVTRVALGEGKDCCVNWFSGSAMPSHSLHASHANLSLQVSSGVTYINVAIGKRSSKYELKRRVK